MKIDKNVSHGGSMNLNSLINDKTEITELSVPMGWNNLINNQFKI